MDLDTFLKFLHVATAAAWLGGTLAGGVFGLWIWRRGTVEDMAGVLRQTAFLAATIFGPATLAVLALGICMTWLNYGFTEAWIDFALAALAVHILVGYGVVMPRFKVLEATLADEGLAESDRHLFGWLMRMGMAHNDKKPQAAIRRFTSSLTHESGPRRVRSLSQSFG